MAGLNAFANDGSFLEQFLQGALPEVRPGNPESAAEQPVKQVSTWSTGELEAAKDEAASRDDEAVDGVDNGSAGREEIAAGSSPKQPSKVSSKEEEKTAAPPPQTGGTQPKAAVKVSANKPLIIRPRLPGGSGGGPSSKKARKESEEANSLSATYLDEMRKYAATSCSSGIDHARPLLK
eukprot:jgi/Mesvir1/24402/Mv11070-RA.1